MPAERARPQGVVGIWGRARCSSDHPLQAPAGPSGARFAVTASALHVLGSTRYSPHTRIPVPIPHPYTRPAAPLHPSDMTEHEPASTCTYDSFDPSKENLGVSEHTLYSGPRLVIYSL